jgi:hypothetical protein
MGALAIFAAQIPRLTLRKVRSSVSEFIKLRKNERALKRLQPRNHSFAVAVPAKLIVIDRLAVFAKVVFDCLEKTISRLETSQRKFPPLCSDCDCHCIMTIRTLHTMPTEFFATKKSSSAGSAEHLTLHPARAQSNPMRCKVCGRRGDLSVCLDHSHCPRACASYPSCVAVYPRD